MADTIKLLGKDLPDDMMRILTHPILGKVFRAYAASASIDESVDFILEAPKARTPQELKKLYDTFMANGAPREINLSSAEVDPIHDLYRRNDFSRANWDKPLAVCVDGIVDLINRHNKPLFHQSTIYAKFCHALAKPELVARKVGITDPKAMPQLKEAIHAAGAGDAAKLAKAAKELWAKGFIDYKHPDVLVIGLKTGKFELPLASGRDTPTASAKKPIVIQKKHFQLMGIPKFQHNKSKERLETALDAWRNDDTKAATIAYKALQADEAHFKNMSVADATKFFSKIKLLP